MIRINRSLHIIPIELNEDNESKDGELARVIDHVENKGGSLKKFSFSTYKIKSVREKLEEIFYKKCAYCETKFTGSSYGHIEHWRPKGGVTENPNHLGYYWLASNWDNLLYSCQICNSSYKKNYFPLENPNEYSLNSADDLEKEKPLLVNPCNDNPDEHFIYELKGDVTGITDKGIISIEKYGLSREDLVIDRNLSTGNLLRLIESILFSIDIASELPEDSAVLNKIANKIEYYFDQINSLIKPESEFSKMYKDILKSQIIKFENNEVFSKLADIKIKF